MPYQLQVPPLASDDAVLERLDELGATDEGADELGATLERALLVVPVKCVANLELALIPLVLLIR